jgi:hypothetical protein
MTTSEPQEVPRTAIDIVICLLPGGIDRIYSSSPRPGVSLRTIHLLPGGIDRIYTALPLSIALIDPGLTNPVPVARHFKSSGPIPPERLDIRQALSAAGFTESDRTAVVPEAILASLARCATLLRSIADGDEQAFDYVDPAAHEAAQLLNDVGRSDLLEEWKLDDK